MALNEGFEERVVGKHVYGSLYDIDVELASNEEYLRSVVEKAVELAGATLLELKSWRIPGVKGGVSVIALVLESHIAVHTWTEYRYATVDVYTCGEHTDPWRAFEWIVESLKPKYYTIHYSDRSQLPIDALKGGKGVRVAAKEHSS